LIAWRLRRLALAVRRRILLRSVLIGARALARGWSRRWRHQMDVLLVFRNQLGIESDCDSFLRFRFERHSDKKAENEDEKKIDSFFGNFEFLHLLVF